MPLPLDREGLSRFLARVGWYMVMMTPPTQPPEVPILFAAICIACVQMAYPPDILKSAEEQRQRLLHSEFIGKETAP